MKAETEEPRRVAKLREKATKEADKLAKNFQKLQRKADKLILQEERELEKHIKMMEITGSYDMTR